MTRDGTHKSAERLHEEHLEFGQTPKYTLYGYAVRNGHRRSITAESLSTGALTKGRLNVFSQWLYKYIELLLAYDNEVYVVLVRSVQVDKNMWVLGQGMEGISSKPKFIHEVLRRSHPDAKSWTE